MRTATIEQRKCRRNHKCWRATVRDEKGKVIRTEEMRTRRHLKTRLRYLGVVSISRNRQEMCT